MGSIPPNESRGYIINIVGWVGAAIATIFVFLRLYSRYFVTQSLGWSDAIIVVAMILNIVTVSLGTVAISYGFGRHFVHIPPENITPTLYYGTVVQPIGIAAYCLPKLSVAILIVGLMGGTHRRGVWFLWFVIVILFLTFCLSFIMLFTQCDPFDHLWHPLEPADCVAPNVLNAIAYVIGSWSAFTDLVLAVFPVILLRNLQIKTSKKISIMAIMGLGAFAMIAAIIKNTHLSTNHSTDASWDLFPLFISTYIETDLVIIAACAPTLPRLVMRLLGKDSEAPTSPSLSMRTLSRGYRAFDGDDPSMEMDSMSGKIAKVPDDRV
ncbi:hypothetical protein BDV95DRAFT_331647 [Massariosphaeria phaeospora]|uniref:Rhodopsin domain-containing protein n=1 Tax=Massariosphaeria phaeospora TaxID=100035 RepID=A0A7C8MBL4_9PLEO|nr:hypothetical protein BDV95DRAFT_331647 [Massariosphaeria phaeospora]